MDCDVYQQVWWRVYQQVVVRVPHPLRFTNILEQETRFIDEWHKQRVEVSAWFVRWLTRRHARVQPAPCCMEWRIPGMTRSYCCLDLYGVNVDYLYYKDELVLAARENRIRVAKSWSKRRIWQELLRAGPRVEPRFQSYLVHTVDHNGRVVSERRTV
jgi:hypothetical protein